AWIDYIGLPADGWDGEGAPPSVPAFTDQPQDASALQPLSWLISSAYAAPKIRRVVSIDFGKTLKELAKQVTGHEVKNLAGAIRVIKKELNVTQFPDIRKYVFRKEMLKSGVWIMTAAGSRSLADFLRGKSNARYSPATILATTAYLGWEFS